MVKGGKISPAKLAMSSASAKKIKEIEKKSAEAAKKNAGKSTVAVNSKNAKPTNKKDQPPKPESPRPAPVIEKEEEVKYDPKKAEKVHYTHDEKRHMKYIRNKIRDGVVLSEEEIAFAEKHKIELTKAKKNADNPQSGGVHNDKTHQKKKEVNKHAAATKKEGHGKAHAAHGMKDKKH